LRSRLTAGDGGVLCGVSACLSPRRAGVDFTNQGFAAINFLLMGLCIFEPATLLVAGLPGGFGFWKTPLVEASSAIRSLFSAPRPEPVTRRLRVDQEIAI
jgi:hypothetical protein